MRVPTGALLLALTGACAHAPTSSDASVETGRTPEAPPAAEEVSAGETVSPIIAMTPAPSKAEPVPELPFMDAPAAPMPGWRESRLAEVRMGQGRFAEALALYTQAMVSGDTNALTAYGAARALARMGRKQEALESLSRAVEWGFHHVKWMQWDHALASLRTEPAFTALLERIPTLPWKDAPAHEELRRLVLEFEADFPPAPAPWEEQLAARERGDQRCVRVKELAAAGGLKTGQDFYAAGRILFRCPSLEAVALAREVAAEAARRGHPNGLWLAVSAWDQWLTMAQRPQRFGTVYRHDASVERRVRYDVDPRVTDEERARWGVLPLAESPLQLPR